MLLNVILYVVLASLVVFLSVKLGEYVDLIDKKTELSGAFIGGVILAAVTSLPELFTSISAVTIVKQPNMVIGNILGSNIFNMTILGVLMIIFAKRFAKSVVGSSHLKTAIFTFSMFALMFIPVYLGYDLSFINISIYSVLIVGMYVLSIRFMAGDTAEDSGEDYSDLTLRQIIVRFIIMSVLLVASSIAITYVTDRLAKDLNLGATLAGALFLGIATSLPELTSCFTLARKNNFNACVGNVLGSGVFNFCILAVADIIYRKGSVYEGDSQSKMLVLFGIISIVLVGITLTLKSKAKKKESEKLSPVYFLLGVGITACYALFIILS